MIREIAMALNTAKARHGIMSNRKFAFNKNLSGSRSSQSSLSLLPKATLPVAMPEADWLAAKFQAVSNRQGRRTVRAIAAGVGTQLMLAAVLLASGGPVSAEARDGGTSGVRVASGVGGFHDVWQYSAWQQFSSQGRLGANHLELSVGALESEDDTRAFIAFGPVWRFRPAAPLYLDLGFSPTLLSGSTFDGRDLGGNFHFTSSATLGTNFGALGRYGLALRIQHTSNGGLNSKNPGLDAIALNFTVDL